VDRAFWKGKKVLITGHTGFKGSWLSLWLQTLDAKVVGYSLPPPTFPNLFDLADVGKGMVTVTGDIRDLTRLKTVVAEHRPDVIFHMAAQSLVRHSYAFPVETYSVNVMGTVNVLEAVRQVEGVPVVVLITSDKCYINSKGISRYREDHPMGGRDPYSSSKGCAELVVSAYRDSYFCSDIGPHPRASLATTRAGNVIGGADWAKDRLIPDIVIAFMNNCPAMIRQPDAIRPWQFVLEPLDGYLTLAEKLWAHGSAFAKAWNFGPSDGGMRPVSSIADHLVSLWGNGAQWVLDSADHPYEDRCLLVDSSQARRLLGWETKLPLHTALQWTVEWYLAYQQNKDVRHLSEAQIARFESIEQII